MDIIFSHYVFFSKEKIQRLLERFSHTIAMSFCSIILFFHRYFHNFYFLLVGTKDRIIGHHMGYMTIKNKRFIFNIYLAMNNNVAGVNQFDFL